MWVFSSARRTVSPTSAWVFIVAVISVWMACSGDSNGAVSFEKSWRVAPVSKVSSQARGVDVASDGTVFVGVDANGYVKKFGPDGLSKGSFYSGDFWVNGLAIGPDDNVFVSNTDGISEFTPDGKTVSTWQPFQEDLRYTTGIAVAADGSVFVTGGGQVSGVLKLSPTGKFIKRFGARVGSGKQAGFGDLAVAPDGTILVADPLAHQVHRFGADGKFISSWGTQGWQPGQFESPYLIDVDGSGSVFVLDDDLDRVQKFDSDGNFIEQWGSQGSGDGHFQFPDGLAANASGSVYTADVRGIQKFSVDDNPAVPAPAISYPTLGWNTQLVPGRPAKIGFLLTNFGEAPATGIKFCPPRKSAVSKLFTEGTACREIPTLPALSATKVWFRMKAAGRPKWNPYINIKVFSNGAGDGIAYTEVSIHPKRG